MSAALPGPSHPPLREGRYVLLRQIGTGTQGTTWDGMDRREGRPVAIKRFDVRGARAWKDVELAEREARVLAGLSHPNLPKYIEHFEEKGALYLVMEKIEGQPLSELRAAGPMPESEVSRLLRDADGVLAYLHGRVPPVVHRDIKPANVIRRPDGSFAFVDFGAVCDRLKPGGGSTVVGTFGYMAPEQFQGRAIPASDVYAVGATAIAMLTGEEPEHLPRRGLAIDVEAALEAALPGRADSRLREPLKRMLEIDPDARATRIGPLLDAARSSDFSAGSGRNLEREIQNRVRREIDRAFRHPRRFHHVAGASWIRRATRVPWEKPRRTKVHWLFAPILLLLGLALLLKPAALIGIVFSGFLLVLLGSLVLPLVLVGLAVHWIARRRNRAGVRLRKAATRAMRRYAADAERAVRRYAADFEGDPPPSRSREAGLVEERRARIEPEEEAIDGQEDEFEDVRKRRRRFDE